MSEGKIKGLTVGGAISSTITTKNLPVRERNMTALCHTQFHALRRTEKAYHLHHNRAEMISNPTPGAPDSSGRAPFLTRNLDFKFQLKLEISNHISS